MTIDKTELGCLCNHYKRRGEGVKKIDRKFIVDVHQNQHAMHNINRMTLRLKSNNHRITYVTQTRVRSVGYDTYPSVGLGNFEKLGHGDTVRILDTGTGTR